MREGYSRSELRGEGHKAFRKRVEDGDLDHFVETCEDHGAHHQKRDPENGLGVSGEGLKRAPFFSQGPPRTVCKGEDGGGDAKAKAEEDYKGAGEVFSLTGRRDCDP